MCIISVDTSGTVPRHATERGPFGLWAYARPFDKVTYVYESTGEKRAEYVDLDRNEHTTPSEDDPIQWLCSMWSLAPTEGYFNTSCDRNGMQEMDYTDEAAKFFVGLFKWIFTVNERIKPFLNPEGIAQLAAGKMPLMLTGD